MAVATLPAAGYFTGSITNLQAKTAQNDTLAFIRANIVGGGTPSELTISSGSVTPISAVHSIDSEANAATDDLDRMAVTNVPDGGFVLIRQEDDGRDIRVRHAQGGSGQFSLKNGSHYQMASSGSWLYVQLRGTTFYEIFRSDIDLVPTSTFQLLYALNEAKGADIPSATTTDIGAATGNFIDVTGTTTITGLGTVTAGAERVVRFTGSLTLTHNATSLILPTADSIVTEAGDVAIFRSLGSGNWQCINYMRADGAAVNKYYNTIASAATTNFGTFKGDLANVTGTTTITALGTARAGKEVTAVFAGALTLTYNATSLILPTKQNIVTAAGDRAIFRSLGSGNWNCISYTRADGAAVGEVQGANVASASTTNIGAATGDFIQITGTTTITAFDTARAGKQVTVYFAGALTLTHNATSLILPGAANITTAAGDRAIFRSLGSGNWTCIAYTKADGTPVSGSGDLKLISSQNVSGATTASITSGIDSTYSKYIVEITNLTYSAASQNLFMEWSINAGSSYLSAGYVGRGFYVGSDGTNSDLSTTDKFRLTDNVNIATNTASYLSNITIEMPGLSLTGYKHMNFRHNYIKSSSINAFFYGGGMNNNNTGAVNGLRFSCTSGTFSATIKLYGVR